MEKDINSSEVKGINISDSAEGKPCIAFDMDNIEEARRHMELEIIEDYGDFLYGHDLYTWDSGCRRLYQCKNCGGYVLGQFSVYEYTSDDRSYYKDYFPVSGPVEADKLNREYNGFSIETEFKKRWMVGNNNEWHWSRAKEDTTCET